MDREGSEEKKKCLKKFSGGRNTTSDTGAAGSRPQCSSHTTGSEQGGCLPAGTLSAGLCDAMGLWRSNRGHMPTPAPLHS